MTFELSKAPGKLVDWKSSRKRAKKSEDGRGQPVGHDKELHLHLDLSHDRYTKSLEWLFPGSQLTSKEMSGADTKFPQSIVNQRRLGRVNVTLVDKSGRDTVVKMTNASLRGTHRLKIGPKGDKREMPLVVIGSVARDQVVKLDDAIDADVLIDFNLVQLDVEEEARKAAAKGKGGKGKGNGKTALVIDGEQLPLEG